MSEPLSGQAERWTAEYRARRGKPVYPTEWVIRTLAGANYPGMKLDRSAYAGKSILDMSCGDGRNLHLLLDLGFVVHATEIGEDAVGLLRERFPDVQFAVGYNHAMPYADNTFDYILSCGAHYYLAPGTTYADNVREVRRILKPDGVFVVNIPDCDNSVARGSVRNAAGELTVADDPFGIRNGVRWQIADSPEEVHALYGGAFTQVVCTHVHDSYWGLVVSAYIAVCANGAVREG